MARGNSSYNRVLTEALRTGASPTVWRMDTDFAEDLMSVEFFAPEAGLEDMVELPPLPSPPKAATPTRFSSLVEEPSAPKRHKKAKNGTSPAAQDEEQRCRALNQWTEVVQAIAGSCKALHSGPPPSAEGLEDYLASKRTGTLLIRASSWRLFLRYARATKVDTHQLTEADIYEYLVHLKKTAAPASRASSFIQACGFAYGTCGFKAGGLVMASPRCNGAAATCMHRKRARRQRDTLQAQWLTALELEVCITAQAPQDSRFSLQEVLRRLQNLLGAYLGRSSRSG